jgi:hypothetical protein
MRRGPDRASRGAGRFGSGSIARTFGPEKAGDTGGGCRLESSQTTRTERSWGESDDDCAL